MDNKHAKEIMEAYRDRLTSSCSNQLDSDIEAFNLAIKALGHEVYWEEENHRNFVNSQHIISLLVEENKKLRGEQ